jgi:ubiquinone/menaquinone biosynthesis C-methylase UbiE
MNELEDIQQRYERRAATVPPGRYDALNPAEYMAAQEKQRALIRWIRSCGLAPLPNKRLLEVGCGTGNDLLEFIQIGFTPENLAGYELIEDRIAEARKRLPSSVTLRLGNAARAEFPQESFDVVYQSTVFTSILDDSLQESLAAKMWSLVKPGGGVLWCDFTYDNPRNPDVRGVPLSRVRQLFSDGVVRSWRIGLAPPISRRITRIHPGLYGLANVFPFLRTHVLCWIEKS